MAVGTEGSSTCTSRFDFVNSSLWQSQLAAPFEGTLFDWTYWVLLGQPCELVSSGK